MQQDMKDSIVSCALLIVAVEVHGAARGWLALSTDVPGAEFQSDARHTAWCEGRGVLLRPEWRDVALAWSFPAGVQRNATLR